MGGTTLAAETPLPQQLARLDSERLRCYRENLDFYHGHQWQEGRRRRDRRLTLNYARAVIEKTASYTMSGLGFVVDPEDSSPEARDSARRSERVIRDVYEANGLEHLDFDNEIDCSVLGDAAYKVWWDTAEARVRVTAPDVQGLYVWPYAGDHSRFWKVARATRSRTKRPSRRWGRCRRGRRRGPSRRSTRSSNSGRPTRSSAGSRAICSRRTRTRTDSSRS